MYLGNRITFKMGEKHDIAINEKKIWNSFLCERKLADKNNYNFLKNI